MWVAGRMVVVDGVELILVQVAVPLIPASSSFVAAVTMRTAVPAPTFAIFAARASVAPF